MVDRFSEWLLHRKLLTLAILAVITGFLGYFATGVQFDNTIETYFLEKDLANYDKFLDQFGTDEIIAIAFSDEDVFTPDNLRLIDSLSRWIEALPHVRRVLSLTTVDLAWGEADEVFFDPLVAEIPASPDTIEIIRRRALADAFIPGTLLARDCKSTAVVAEIDHLVGQFDYKVELLEQIRALLEATKQRTGKQFHLGGAAVLDDAIFRYNARDQQRFTPVMVVVIVLIVAFMFRRPLYMLLPVLVVVLSLVWTYGFLVLLGYKVNIISSIITPVLMAVSIADSMHFIVDYLQEMARKDGEKSTVIKQTFAAILAPCTMTSLTTIFGLLSLLSADLVPIRQFGLVAAGGVLFAFVITFTLLPVLLALLPLPKVHYRKRLHRSPLARALERIGRWSKPRAVAITLAVLILAVPASISLKNITIGTNSLDYLKPGDPVRVQTEWIDSHIGGTVSLEFLIDTGEEGGMQNPELLRRVERFQNYLEKLDGITGTYSAADLVKTLNRAYHGGQESYNTIPDSASHIAQQLLLVEGSDDFSALLAEDYTLGRISARVEMAKSQQLSHGMPAIEDTMRAIFGSSANMAPTGIAFLMHQMETALLDSQIKTFMLAFLVISLVILVMLRSLRLGLLAMVPNVLPILFALALMPLMGIPLDVGTVMIAGVALGLVVDDSIHLLSRIKRQLHGVGNHHEAMRLAILETGRPIVFTSVALASGFLILVLASFNPIINFGILSCIVITLALLFDLLVLPALFGLSRQK